MSFIKELLSEKGDISSMRFMCILALLIAGYLAISGKDTSVLTFVGAAFSGKFAQKITETKGS